MTDSSTPVFQKILFPVDLSPASVAAIPFVKEMAHAHGATITLMQVVQLPAPWYPPDGGVPITAYDVNELLELAASQLADFKGQHFADISSAALQVDQYCEEGDAALSIVDHARRSHTDLIMMPTHGLGPFRRLLLGSVTAKVLHDAECAVWTGAHVEESPVKEHASVRSILCAVDTNAASAGLIAQAAGLAAKHSAVLRLVHSVPGMETRPQKYCDAEFERGLMASARDSIAAMQRDLKSNFEVCVAAGTISKVIQSAALQHQADLIVIGRGVLQETLGRLRTNAYAIVRDSPCPVISF